MASAPNAIQNSIDQVLLPSHWLLSRIAIVDTMDNGERGMNPIAITIINLRKEYKPRRELKLRPLILKSCRLPTKLQGLVSCCLERY